VLALGIGSVSGAAEVGVKGNAYLAKVVENLQREDLDPIDAARALQMLKGELNSA
jgi:ParB-like chromosome segregation protein Spo0J